MRPFDWYPESFSPVGNITSEGVQRQLGRYDLDPLAVLVRETVQNSWDARLPNQVPHYAMQVWTLSEDQHQVLRSIALPSRPQGLQLQDLDTAEPLAALAITDRHTSGLVGPVRADQVSPSSEERDFVDFLLNVGQNRNTEFGGGTYGYGKSILYRLSRLRTILVHTHTTVGGRRVSRFMAAALGHQYEGHTGRHWWGHLAQDGYPEPVTGERADELAQRLGLPAFDEGETGTTIVMLAPDLGTVGENDEARNRSPEEAMAYAGANILWNFWPKMLASCPEHSRMTFSLGLDGTALELPDPARHPLFRVFIQAMRDVEQARADPDHRPDERNRRVEELRSLRPKRGLGLLALRRAAEHASLGPLPSRLTSHHQRVEQEIRNLAPAPGAMRHVALMRDARLLVRYEEGPASEEGQYAGVFLVHRDQEVDHAFAEAEPPTHDDWQPTGMERPWATYVRVALRRLREAVNDFAQRERDRTGDGIPAALGQFSTQLAGLMAPIESTGPGVDEPDEPAPGRRRPGGKRRKRPSVKAIDGGAVLEQQDGHRIARFRFQVTAPSTTESVRVRARAAPVILDGSTVEQEPPAGAEQPTVLRWEDRDGSRMGSGDIVDLPADPGAIWSVLVTVPQEAAVSVDVTAEEPAE